MELIHVPKSYARRSVNISSLLKHSGLIITLNCRIVIAMLIFYLQYVLYCGGSAVGGDEVFWWLVTQSAVLVVSLPDVIFHDNRRNMTF